MLSTLRKLLLQMFESTPTVDQIREKYHQMERVLAGRAAERLHGWVSAVVPLILTLWLLGNKQLRAQESTCSHQHPRVAKI